MIHHIDSLEAKEAAYHSLFSIVPNGEFDVIICRYDEKKKATSKDRSDAQRALDWEWNRVIARSTTTSPEWCHGESKLKILLPMYYSFNDRRRRRAEHVKTMLNYIVKYSHKVSYAFDSVRTNDLSVKQMAQYLAEKQSVYAEDGIQLESNKDLEFKDLMVYVDNNK